MPNHSLIQCCAYCEQTPAEIVAYMQQRGTPVSQEDALRFVLIRGKTLVPLCPDDRAELRELTEEEIWEALNAPIDLPANTRRLVHTCPMLLYDGGTTDEATMEVELVEEAGYFRGSCPECGMVVRSPVEKDRAMGGSE